MVKKQLSKIQSAASPSKNIIKKAIVTVYKSGNSKVITIPEGMSLELGDKLKLSIVKNKIILKKIDDDKSAKLRELRKHLGHLSTPGVDNMAASALEEQLEGV